MRFLIMSFLEVIRILCSHHAFVQSSGSYAFIVPFVRSHAVEAVQGKVSEVFL
jgi:hypothetical protein